MSETNDQKKPTSTLRMLFYLILGAVLLTVFLEATDLADVAGKREHQEIIDHPHD